LHAAEAGRIEADAQAANINAVEGARLTIEQRKIEAYAIVPPAVMLGLAAREFAGKIENINQLSLTPDLVGPYLTRIFDRPNA